MTFRAKLQQAILGVVAGTTVAVLWVAQTQNSVSYRRMVDTLFRQQMEIFRREQDSQLQLAKQQATRLADSVRLFAALEEGDPETYKVAVDELRLAEFDFFRLASTQTGLMPPPEGTRTGHFRPDVETSLETQLNQAAKAIPEDEPNAQVGFVSLSSEDGSQQFYRVLAMQIRNFDQTVGTLFLGQSVRRFIPKVEDANAPQMQTAFWTQEGLLSEGIPLLTKTEMTRQLATIGTQAQLDFSFQVAGVDHYAHLHLLNPKSHFQPTWLVSIFSLADLQTQQQELRLRVIAIGLIALCLASVVAWFFAAQLA